MTVTEQVLKEHREKRQEINQIHEMLNNNILNTEGQEAVHMKEYYTELLREYDLEHYEIEKVLIHLPANERIVIRAYYLSENKKTWEDVSSRLHFSLQHIFRLKKSALKKLSQS